MLPHVRRRQRLTLRTLQPGPLTTRQIADALDVTINSAHGAMRRLEDRELVRRVGDSPYKWELTGTARTILETT